MGRRIQVGESAPLDFYTDESYPAFFRTRFDAPASSRWILLPFPVNHPLANDMCLRSRCDDDDYADSRYVVVDVGYATARWERGFCDSFGSCEPLLVLRTFVELPRDVMERAWHAAWRLCSNRYFYRRCDGLHYVCRDDVPDPDAFVRRVVYAALSVIESSAKLLVQKHVELLAELEEIERKYRQLAEQLDIELEQQEPYKALQALKRRVQAALRILHDSDLELEFE